MPSSDLAEYFRSQARWREMKAEEYPDDARNAQSAEALSSLAEYIESGEAEARCHGIEEALGAHLFEQFSFGGEATQREVVRYGFGYKTGPNQHEAFLEDLHYLCLEDAYAAIGDGTYAEDPSESLHDFEIAAARDGVALPRRYWERRGKWLIEEQEEAVNSYRVEEAR